MRSIRMIAAVVTAAWIAGPAGAFAEEASRASLEERLASLEQQVAVLRRQLEVKDEETAKKAPDTAVVTASAKDGFSIKSPDDAFKLKVRGLLNVDGRLFTDNKKDIGTTDTFLVRRARPIFEGNVYKNFGFYIMPELGGGSLSLVDGYADYLHSPEFKLRAGKFKEPFHLERLQSIAAANFVELGLPANLSPNRDVGAQVYGDVWNEGFSYALGVFNGSADQGSSGATDVDTNNDKDVAARVFVQPFRNTDNTLFQGLGLGVAGTHGHKEGGTTPTFRSPGQASVFSFQTGTTADGPHTRLSPQGYWYWRNIGVLAEHVTSNQELVRGAVSDKFENTAWQVSGGYVLTGEDASFKGVKPKKPFNWATGDWGAWEIVSRYGELDLDDAYFDKNFALSQNSITDASAWAVGVNWYLNNNVRWMLDFERTNFSGGGLDGEDRQPESAILTRWQIAY